MTDSLEDTIAKAAHVWMYGDNGTRYTRRETEAMANAIAEAVRAAGVVPAEPATPPWPKFCPICLAAFHEDGTVTPSDATSSPMIDDAMREAPAT